MFLTHVYYAIVCIRSAKWLKSKLFPEKLIVAHFAD